MVLAVACGGGGDGSEGAGPPPGPDGEDFGPLILFSGFNGTDTFQVPVFLFGEFTGEVTWESLDPAVATIAPVARPSDAGPPVEGFREEFAMVTTTGAGTTKIRGTAGGETIEMDINVTQYTVDQVAAGRQRYNMPANPDEAARKACASCHALANGVDHSPNWLSPLGDAEILGAIRTGVYEFEGGRYELRGVNHAFDLTDAEAQGIVPFLRSLPPRGFAQ